MPSYGEIYYHLNDDRELYAADGTENCDRRRWLGGTFGCNRLCAVWALHHRIGVSKAARRGLLF